MVSKWKMLSSNHRTFINFACLSCKFQPFLYNFHMYHYLKKRSQLLVAPIIKISYKHAVFGRFKRYEALLKYKNWKVYVSISWNRPSHFFFGNWILLQKLGYVIFVPYGVVISCNKLEKTYKPSLKDRPLPFNRVITKHSIRVDLGSTVAFILFQVICLRNFDKTRQVYNGPLVVKFVAAIRK